MEKYRVQTSPIPISWQAADLSDKNLNFTMLQGVRGLVKNIYVAVTGSWDYANFHQLVNASRTPKATSKLGHNWSNLNGSHHHLELNLFDRNRRPFLQVVVFYAFPNNALWFLACFSYVSEFRIRGSIWGLLIGSRANIKLETPWKRCRISPMQMTIRKIRCNQSLWHTICRIYNC